MTRVTLFTMTPIHGHEDTDYVDDDCEDHSVDACDVDDDECDDVDDVDGAGGTDEGGSE